MRGLRTFGGAVFVAAGIASAGSLAAPPTAVSSWKVEAASPARPAFLLGLAALPDRRTAALLQELRGGERRLVVRRSGRSPRVLAISRHTFEASLGVDARGREVVVWQVSGEASTVHIWIANRARALSRGSGRATSSLAVDADGGVVVGVARRGGGAAGSVVVYRGSTSGSIGQPVAVPSLTGIETVGVGAGTRVVLAGQQLVAPPPSTKLTSAFTSAAGGVTAPFAQPAALEPAPGPLGQTSFVRRTTVGIAPGGAAVAATNTLHCVPGSGDLAGECTAPVTGTVQVTIWPAGAPGAAAPVTVSGAPYTSDPQFVRSGDDAWVTWLEGSTAVLDTMAAVLVRSTGVGRVHRHSVPASRYRLANEPPDVAAARGGGVRWYTLARASGVSTLSTTVLDTSGRFSPRTTITHDISVRTSFLTEPATGAPDDLVGWTTSTTNVRGTRASVAWPVEPGRRKP